MEDEFGFTALNQSMGNKLSLGRMPDATYHLRDGTVNMYSYSPSLGDRIHPFRPSGEVLVEVGYLSEDLFSMYLVGDIEDFEDFDDTAMELLEAESNPDYYKEIL